MLERHNLGDWGAMLAALVLASMVWLHAVTEDTYRREFVIPLHLETQVADAEGTGQLIVANAPPAAVRVLVSGSGKDLLRASGSDFALELRPASARESVPQTYSLTAAQVEVLTTLPVEVEEVLDPVEISITLEPLVAKEVPVRPQLALTIAESYTQVGAPRVEPDRVRVTGPRSRVGALEAVLTDSLIRDQIRSDIDLRLALRADTGHPLSLSQADVRLRIDVQELAEYPIAGVPVTVRNVGGREVVVEPSRVQVRVRGGADVIGHLDPESDLGLFVDYEAWIRSGEKVATVQSTASDLFEIRQIVPSEVTVAAR